MQTSGVCGLPGMWLGHEREGCSDWLPAGPLSGRRQSSVCQSLFLWSAPGLEPETHWIKAEDTLPTFCIAVKTNSGDQVCACGGWGVVWADGLLFNGLFCPLVAFLGQSFSPLIAWPCYSEWGCSYYSIWQKIHCKLLLMNCLKQLKYMLGK